MNQGIVMLLAGMVVCLLGILGCLTYKYCRIKQLVHKTMLQVDDTLEQLLLGKQVQYFKKNEDSLLGKFQTQAARLYDMRTAYEHREEKLRMQMSSSISDLVHQINTPIANIKVYSDFLKDDALTPEEYLQFADNLQRQAQKLSWLGEGFSKISRLETGIINLKPKVQPVLPVLLAAIDQAAPKAERHQNDIQLTGDHHLEAYLDRRWTEEVFFNLLDNAVKYSEAGSDIQIELTVYEMYIGIHVCSRGTKIEREEFPKLFQRFYRGKEAKDKEGVGLGLYLAREIIRGQRGYMKGKYEPVRGNIFSVFLLKEQTRPM